MGELIASLRKEKGITQKELAEKLNVTDKAISKWERGNGFPEITIVPVLANELGISVNELLNCEQDIKDDITHDEADKIVSNTIEYMEKTSKYKASVIAVSIITIVFMIAMFVCLLCNYVINRRFDWSLYPAGALVVAWIAIAPLLLLKKNKIICALCGMTLSVIPYLFLVEYLCPAKGWVIPLALPDIAVSFVAVLCIVILFLYTKISKLYALAITIFLTGVVLNLIVNKITVNFLDSRLSNLYDGNNDISLISVVLTSALASVIFAIWGFVRSLKHRVG